MYSLSDIVSRRKFSLNEIVSRGYCRAAPPRAPGQLFVSYGKYLYLYLIYCKTIYRKYQPQPILARAPAMAFRTRSSCSRSARACRASRLLPLVSEPSPTAAQ